MQNDNHQTSLERARSRLSAAQREKLTQTIKSRERAMKQKRIFQIILQNLLVYLLQNLPRVVAAVASTLGLIFLVTTTPPSMVANIPFTNSYGPFLILFCLTCYFISLLLTNSGKISISITSFLLILTYLKINKVLLEINLILVIFIIHLLLTTLWMLNKKS